MALKWRPQTFADMVGQVHITRTLQNSIKADRVAHAYIFSGPRGVGKTTTARIFAKALNCRNLKDTEPCNECDMCQEVNQGSAMDVIEIDAASVNGIDGIRALQEQVGTYPAKGKYKVYIFDEAHRISKAAFDAFLKTLEEPPAHVIFILASTEIHQFPATVQSRCQRYEFRSMVLDAILKQLRRISDAEKIEIDDKSLYQIARSAGGSMRDAQRNLDQLVAFAGKKVTMEDIRVVLGTIEGEVYLKLAEAAISMDAPAGLMVVRGILEGGKDLEHFYGGLLETFRHLAVAKAYPSSAAALIPLSKEEVEKIVQLSSQMEEAQILSSLRILIEQEWALRHSANPSIILETVVMELCRLKALTSVGDLLRQMEGGSAPSLPAPVKSAISISKPAPPATPAYTPPAAPEKTVAQEGEPALAVEEIEDAAPDNQNPDMAKLKSHWRELLEKVKAQKTALEGVLVDTRPKNIDEGTLILVCKGPFHQEQLSKPENKVLVQKLLEELLGRKINLVPVLPEAAPTASHKPSGPRAPKPASAPKVDVKELEKEEPLVAAALKMFGGKIVEVKRNNPQK
jgi:DNA polymerase-3 subunit gamma/tau